MTAESDSNPKDAGFNALFGHAKPVGGKERHLLKVPKRDTPAQQARRAAAIQESPPITGLSTSDVPQIEPKAWLDFAQPGVQTGVLRKLRLGQYPPDARLDLHGISLEKARVMIPAFLKECIDHDIRCALIAHGGGSDRAGSVSLKSCVAHWLPQLDPVLAFHSAQRRHGGLGATYVLLRKSLRQRQETFEIHSRRRKP